MKLLIQSDDFGITFGVTDGIVHGIKNGLIKNTGLFVNMESSEYAASLIKEYPEVCFGLDINFVTGKPVSPREQVPALVDENGDFIKSTVIHAQNNKIGDEGFATIFEDDPYPFEQVLIETESQVNRFLELVGRKPDYLHGHSLITPNIMRAFRLIARKYELKISFDMLKESNAFYLPTPWNIKPLFTLEKQMETDVEQLVLNSLPSILEHDLSVIICHAGFVDDDLFNYSTYTLIRNKDLSMVTSTAIHNWLRENNVELITYRDL